MKAMMLLLSSALIVSSLALNGCSKQPVVYTNCKVYIKTLKVRDTFVAPENGIFVNDCTWIKLNQKLDGCTVN
jgi:hypothetical protein